jgi:hypothetical protein
VSGARPALPERTRLPAHVRPLVEALVLPATSTRFDLRTWSDTVRIARSAQLLGALAQRLQQDGVWTDVPAPARSHLQAALFEVRHVHHLARTEMREAAAALCPLGVAPILLKGCAILVQGLPHAQGRLLRDVDLMVPQSRLADAERALLQAGWRYDDGLDDYDQHYYRAWSHQLAPLRREGAPLELDVHHTILPPTGRVNPDAAALAAAARPSPDADFRIPAPADQVIHAAVHLFQDSDCSARLRDVFDIDAMCRHFGQTEEAFWSTLVERARRHGASGALWYALAFARGWFDTPVPDAVVRGLEPQCASARARNWVLARASIALPPPDPDRPPTGSERRARRALRLRAIALRMPVPLLVYHVAMKGWRRLRHRRPAVAGAPQP